MSKEKTYLVKGYTIVRREWSAVVESSLGPDLAIEKGRKRAAEGQVNRTGEEVIEESVESATLLEKKNR